MERRIQKEEQLFHAEAKKVLHNNIDRLLQQRLGKTAQEYLDQLGKSSDVWEASVLLRYTDFPRSQHPPKLLTFIDQHYNRPENPMHLQSIYAGDSYIAIKVAAERPAEGLERFSQGFRVIVRDQALDTTLYLLTNTMPFLYGYKEYSVREWAVKKRLPVENYQFINNTLNPELVKVISKMLPDQLTKHSIIDKLRRRFATEQPEVQKLIATRPRFTTIDRL